VGSLIVPAAGTVYVDTQVIIYTVQNHPVYAPLLKSLWQSQSDGHVKVATSQLSLMECLIGPLRWKDGQLLADFETFFQTSGLVVASIEESVLRNAAQLRADHKSLRTPDAIHAATSFQERASLFISNDRGFRAIPGLPLALLDDILASP
jgi:predicted nucleic acid-binding protein